MNNCFKATNGTIVSNQRTERWFQHNERSFQDNQRNDCLHKGMEWNNHFNTTEQNDCFSTTGRNETILLTQPNGQECSFYHNGKEQNGSQNVGERDTVGNFY